MEKMRAGRGEVFAGTRGRETLQQITNHVRGKGAQQRVDQDYHILTDQPNIFQTLTSGNPCHNFNSIRCNINALRHEHTHAED